MELLEELKWRGLVKDITSEEGLSKLLENPLTLYVGFDPTGDSLHVGHLVPLLMLRRFQLRGHHAIALAGGGTGMIGDPGGRKSERQLLSADQIAHNVECIKKQLSGFLDFEGNNPAKLLNNYDWLSKINLIDFLRDYGKNFSVNYMLAKDVVASRLEVGISYTEFSYMILQSIDFLTLKKEHNCCLQLGGSDQWGNLTAGCDMIKKIMGSDTQIEAMTLPLITKSDGTKFGKSEGHAIWLDPNKTSPYEFYQFWINVKDEEVGGYLKVFTFLTKEEIENILTKHQEAPHLRLAQKTLASEMTTIVHGKEASEEAINITKVLFSGEIQNLTIEQVKACFSGVVSVDTAEDLNILDALVNVKAASSKREAREFVNNGSILINGEKIQDLEFVVSKNNAFGNEATVIRRGKKNYYVIKHI